MISISVKKNLYKYTHMKIAQYLQCHGEIDWDTSSDALTVVP